MNDFDFEVKGEDQDILCLPRCDVHSCDGCVSKRSCEDSNIAHGIDNAGCVWDSEAQMCFKECIPAGYQNRYGDGCFTCETKHLCDDQRAHGCKWDEEIDVCTNDDDDVTSTYYGDIVNPVNDLPFVNIIMGNLILENDGSDLSSFDTFVSIKQIVGHLVIHDNTKLEEVDLSQLSLLHGNIEILHNPNLKSVLLNPSLELVGCLKLLDLPNLDPNILEFLGRFKRCMA